MTGGSHVSLAFDRRLPSRNGGIRTNETVFYKPGSKEEAKWLESRLRLKRPYHTAEREYGSYSYARAAFIRDQRRVVQSLGLRHDNAREIVVRSGVLQTATANTALGVQPW